MIKVNYSYELPFGPDKPFLKDGLLGQIVGGWRIAGVHAYASGYPLTVLPGYGLPLNAGDNRITVLDYHDWRAATQGDDFNPLVDLWWDPAKFLRTGPVDSVDQLQGYKGGVLRADFGNATVRNPYERGPWYPEREHLARAHVRHRPHEPGVQTGSIQSVQPGDLGQPGIDDHQRQFRQGDDAGERAAADAAGVPIRVLRGRSQ